jgi:hypothetical protein
MQKHTLQVFDQNDLPIGAAFLVDNDLLLACAHLVRAASSRCSGRRKSTRKKK